MARPVRIDVEDHWYHVIARGQRGEALFLRTPDYVRYLTELQSALNRKGGKLGAYCPMTNHVHLLVYRGENSLASIMQLVHSRYARYFNRRYGKRGYVFQGRYRAFLVLDDRYLAALVRYIHRNPVEAGLVRRAMDYRWSSDRFYRGYDAPSYVKLVRVPGFEGERGANRYKDLMLSKEKLEVPVFLTFVGKEGMEKGIERRKPDRSRLKWREKRGASQVLSRAAKICGQMGQLLERLRTPSRQRIVARFRNKIMSRLYRDGYSPADIARTFNRTPAAVFRACERARRK